jgi:hypothetical protein
MGKAGANSAFRERQMPIKGASGTHQQIHTSLIFAAKISPKMRPQESYFIGVVSREF